MKILPLFKEKSSAATTRAPHPKVRSPNWDFSDFKWESANPDATENNVFLRAYLVGLSLLFPEGERFFIRAVRRYAEEIKDPQLKQDVKGFIAQEAQHGRQHELLNENIFGARYEVKDFLSAWTGFAFGFLEPFAARFIPTGGGKLELAITAAAEHYTAAWGSAALRSEIFAKFESQQIKDLVYWHAIEEIEHKHVAFDVMREVANSYPLRISAMIITTFLIGGLSVWGFLHILKQERNVDWGEFFSNFGFELINKDGMFRQFAEAFVSYFRPGFHPSDVNDYELAAAFAKEVEARIGKIA